MRMTTDSRIKIAVQKSGRLTEHSLELLRCGLGATRGKDQLICYGENMPVDVLLVRDDDIPAFCRKNTCDLGTSASTSSRSGDSSSSSKVRRNSSARSAASTSASAACRSACPPVCRSRVRSSYSKRIATTYPRILKQYLRKNGVDAQIVAFSGAVEIAPSLGKADLICDLVSMGSTLRAHQLYEAATILESRAALIKTPKPISGDKAWSERLLKRIQGVLEVKESKYIMLHAPRLALKAITALLPGTEAPTIIPLEGRDDKVAVHAVCRENVLRETLEQLKEAGASSMLVLPVEKMLA